MDDMKMYQTDNYERLKPTMPKKGSIVGTTTVVPTMDTDEKLIWFDPQGESLYTNPPNPNAPLVDHGLDELQPWAFRKTNYNQIVVHNRHTRDLWSAIKEHNAPWWGKKLAAPHFYTKEKFEKFLSQYALRLDFENLKTRHARELMPGDLAQRDAATGGSFKNRLVDGFGIAARGFVVPDDEAEVAVFVQHLRDDLSLVSRLQ